MKNAKKWMVGVVFLILLWNVNILASEEMGTLVKIGDNDTWVPGTLDGLTFNPANENEIMLARDHRGYLDSGTYISHIVELPSFNRLVPSWIVTTPPKTYIEIFVQVMVNNTWSMWYPLGKWDTNYSSASSTGSDTFGYVSIDTIILRSGYYADAFRLKAILHTKDRSVTPILKFLAVTAFNNTNPPTTPIELIPGWERELNVPMRSQMIEDSKVAGSICSPTSVSMVLEYYGINRTTEEIYNLVYDNYAKIYGNWPFNTATAGSFGLEAYVDYFFTINEIKNFIAQGVPIICSIAFAEGELDGAPISSTSGHLVVVRGFVIRDGQEYVICNDPAAPDNTTVRREYKVEQFVDAWKKWVYVIKPLT